MFSNQHISSISYSFQDKLNRKGKKLPIPNYFFNVHLYESIKNMSKFFSIKEAEVLHKLSLEGLHNVYLLFNFDVQVVIFFKFIVIRASCTCIQTDSIR